MAEDKGVISGSIFWIIFILIGFMGLVALGIWGYQAESIKAISLAVVFSVMLIGSIAITKGEIFRMGGSWGGESLAFTTMFFLSYFIQRIMTGSSLFSMAGNSLFATIKSNLSYTTEVIMDIIIIPIAEEQVWIVALPILLFYMFDLIGKNKNMSFMNNKVLQLILVIIVCSITFAVFHVGSIMIIGFVIGAVIFRTLMIILFWGDNKKNIFSNFTFYVSGVLGAHSGNNVASYGMGDVVSALTGSIWGILLMLFFLVIFGSAVYFLVMKLIWRKGGKAK